MDASQAHFAQPVLSDEVAARFCNACGLEFETSEAFLQHVDNAVPDSTDPSDVSPPVLSKIVKQGCVADRELLVEHVPGGLRIHVCIGDLPVRLKQFLRGCQAVRAVLPSNSDRHNALKTPGAILVNGVEVEDSRHLAAGDVVTLALDAELVRRRQQELTGSAKLEVRYHDGQVAVVWKPAGVRTLGSHRGTLETGLPWALRDLEGFKAPPPPDGDELLPRALPISRIETHTAGLVVVALTRKSLASLHASLSAGRLLHTFRLLLRGPLTAEAAAGVRRLPVDNFSEDRCTGDGEECESASTSEEDDDKTSGQSVDEYAASVVIVDASPRVTTVDVCTAAFAGKATRRIGALFVGLGAPILGGYSARRADRAAEGGGGAKNVTRGGHKMQIMCRRVVVKLDGGAHVVDVEAPELTRFERLRRQEPVSAGKG